MDCDSLISEDFTMGVQIIQVNLRKKANSIAHHTSDFQNEKLVLRRGQVFHLLVVLNRPLGPQDQLMLQFITGKKNAISRHTMVELNARTSNLSQDWKATISKVSGSEVTVAVTSSPDALVGKYRLSVKCGNHTFKCEKIFLLFNPWCKEDKVFMPNEEERTEYVLNDTGYIYMGVTKQIRGKPWIFGQFEKHILNCCLSLLKPHIIKTTDMNDPVEVSRSMCTMMSSANKGVLVGNWSGDYSKGTAPYVWTSSVPILQQYYTTKMPVNFGQCWVFSGILTTALRALGIPTRSVTNFESAHDTEKNLTVDIFLDENGKTIGTMTRDSVWNFHVWNDVWMMRSDENGDNHGWQALDGTPQEISQERFRCGPAPLTAIRKGDVAVKYDTKFIFTEVNGDKLIWLVKQTPEDKKFILIAVETMSIGKNISTKAVGQDQRVDITYQYKYPEGSPEERQAMNKASNLLNKVVEHKPPTREDFYHISVTEDSVQLGDPIILTIVLKRNMVSLKNVNISCSLDLQTYTGKRVASLGVIQKTVQIQNPETEVVLTMNASSYINSLGMLDDELVIKGFAIAEVVGSNNEMVATEVSLSFLYPDFFIEMPNTARVDQPLIFTCSFKNSLPIPLTEIKFSVESLGISSMKTMDQGVLPPGKSIQFQMNCVPVKLGPSKFIIKFTSRQVKEVHAEKMVLITN
uniref:protein-glutamine gamma-glutamyltransferase 4 n=1 Tax=Jaculus jaculus TaxID=51337 RepID=UPI001E1B55C8|nr:protein-glutamine gamma-glutamyltransferase 4 [Jaculus jaculus]